MLHKIIPVLGCLVMLVAACSPASPTLTPVDLCVGLITDVGSVRDGTFNEFAHRGALRAQEEFGLGYQYRESVADSHWALHLQDLINIDCADVIITVGFFMTDFTLAQAAAYPDTYFVGVDQFYAEPPPNAQGLQFQEDEGGFLAGALAGMMTESGTVGILAGEHIPPVERYVEGFINGVWYTNPEAEALHVYAPSFVDAEFGRDKAQEWITNQGVDVIFGAGGLTGSAGIFEAAQLGSWVIGVDQDEYRTTFQDGTLDGADRILTTAVKRVDNGVYQAIESIVNDAFTSGVVVLGTADNGVGYAPFHDAADAIPRDVADCLADIWRALAGQTLQTGASGSADDVRPDPLGDGDPPVAADAPPLPDWE
ncbi:BMP family ABC transporter substrate-binding protein [Chloroflexota bacterium]